MILEFFYTIGLCKKLHWSKIGKAKKSTVDIPVAIRK